MEEVFGPALPIWRVRDLDEAIERANASVFGLGSSVWTRDLHRVRQAAERIEAGYTWVNSRTKVYDEMPFGGWKVEWLRQGARVGGVRLLHEVSGGEQRALSVGRWKN